MKRFTKSIALVLSVVLCLTFLMVACEPKTETSPSPSPSPSGDASPVASPEASPEASGEPKTEVKFTYPVWSPVEFDYLTKEVDLPGLVKAKHPHITVEIELLKETDYESTMMIRKGSGELPDVFPLQGKWLNTFKEGLYDQMDTLAAYSNQLYPEQIKVDGKVIGIPQAIFGEVVFYNKKIFDELKLTVPTTWPELITVMTTIRDNGKYIPLAMGAKDAWPDYPFNEFLPYIISQDNDYWSTIATIDDPFSPDKPFYKAYRMIQDLYNTKCMGKDPLSVSWDQSIMSFASEEAAVIAAGTWLYADLKGKMTPEALQNVGAFLMPARQTTSEDLYTTIMLESYVCINKDTKNLEDAKLFVDFLMSDEYYQLLVNKMQFNSTTKTVQVQGGDTVITDPFKDPSTYKVLTYKAGDSKYSAIVDAMQFDVKNLGLAMMQSDTLDKTMADLNNQWKAARASLG